ncbi:MAG TPA: hypothetical protein VMU70_01495 [Candidatus Tyrphobacter sp.]|nr:hypothetical protein [Candidatus Tyrphobacter sp.]
MFRFFSGLIVSMLGIAIMAASFEHETFHKFIFLGILVELFGLGILLGYIHVVF